MNARLKVLHQKSSVKSVKLLPTTTVGRSTECDLKIASSQVSRLHCRITVHDDAVYIEDLGSANGTFVNDQPLVPHQVTVVEPGTKIAIGPAEFLMDYVAPTTNTVVVRRSPKGTKPSPQDFEIQTPDSDSELFDSSPSDAVKVAPAPVVTAPVVTAPVVTAPVIAKTVTEPVVPVAKVINIPQTRSSIPNVEPQTNQLFETPQLEVVSKATPVTPEIVEAEIHAEFPNLTDTAPMSEGLTEFNFSEPSQTVRATKPSAKGGKGGGIKSILSMFGSKPTKAKSKTNAESSQAPAEVASDQPEPVTTAPADVPEEPSMFGFIAAEPEHEVTKESVQKPSEDDDFQRFLQQF